MNEFFFEIPGVPIAKRRPRFSRGRTYSDQKEQENDFKWLLKVAHSTEEQLADNWTRRTYHPPLAGPIFLKIIFTMPIPASFSKKKRKLLEGKAHLKTPDLDNLLKFFMDCANGILWKDDVQVYAIHAGKEYGVTPETRAEVIEHS
jgi:Holliday junction resolvase RusA-like endonuclease